jgi:hypothetical protein
MGYGSQGKNGISCDMTCPNNANEICGGGNANSIYTSGSCPGMIFFIFFDREDKVKKFCG